jgi:hypothetical protein
MIAEAFNLAGDYPSSVTYLCESWIGNCTSLSSISFESGSNLQRIDEFAFSHSGLTIRCKFDPDSNEIDESE